MVELNVSISQLFCEQLSHVLSDVCRKALALNRQAFHFFHMFGTRLVVVIKIFSSVPKFDHDRLLIDLVSSYCGFAALVFITLHGCTSLIFIQQTDRELSSYLSLARGAVGIYREKVFL